MLTTPDSIRQAATADAAEEIFEITEDMIMEVLAEGAGNGPRTPPPIPARAAA